MWTDVHQEGAQRDRYHTCMREIRDRCRFRVHLLGARLRLRAQGGFALIEVVVSAALLLVVAGGVLAGIEGPSRISGKNETRSQATDLAQQDQERLRSMSFTSLVGYTQTTPVTVGGVTYTRYSSAVWIHDNGDPDSCSTQTNTNTGDYLKITSRVTPPAGGGSPVQVDSLTAAPAGQYSNKGTLAVLLTDQAAQPVVGQNVSITGPVNMTVPTNSIGCAVFGLVPKGNYTATFSRTGWVDPAAVTNVSLATSVTANSTTIVPHLYAPAGRINVSVETKVGGAVPAPSPAQAVMVSNSGIPTGTLTFPAPATPAQGVSSFALDVFPFQSGYNVWAGGCTTNDPTKFSQPAYTATPPPGGSAGVTVRQPALDLTVNRNGSPWVNSHVVVTTTDIGCSTKFTSSTLSTGKMTPAGFPGPGFPFGNYRVCADDARATTRYAQTNVVNTAPAGVTFSLNIPSSGNGNPPRGVCT
jgi:type II secretory pathway pseudopilin PulG